jgi:hypothetical protein
LKSGSYFLLSATNTILSNLLFITGEGLPKAADITLTKIPEYLYLMLKMYLDQEGQQFVLRSIYVTKHG